MKTIKLDTAKADQLRYFAEVHLGLEVPETAKPVQIRALMQQAGYNKETIEVDESLLVPAARPEKAAASGKIKIIVATQEGPGGDRPIFVSVNDRPMYIPRGEPVEIAPEFVEVLNNAKQIVYEATESSGLGRKREVLTYPFQIVG